MIAIQGGTIVTMAGERIHDGVILVEDKKIKAVGKDIAIPEGAQVIDASDKWVTPGLIDAHTHLSTFNEPQVINGRTDANEMSGPMQNAVIIVPTPGFSPSARPISTHARSVPMRTKRNGQLFAAETCSAIAS